MKSIQKKIASALASIAVFTAIPAQAGYVCEGAKAGDGADVSGSLVLQSTGSYVLEQAGGGYLVQIIGTSDGESVDSYLSINEATRMKMQRCPSLSKISFRVKCKAKGEPEVITLVC